MTRLALLAIAAGVAGFAIGMYQLAAFIVDLGCDDDRRRDNEKEKTWQR